MNHRKRPPYLGLIFLFLGLTAYPLFAQGIHEIAPPEGMPLPPPIDAPGQGISQDMDTAGYPGDGENLNFSSDLGPVEADLSNDGGADDVGSGGGQHYTIKKGDTLGSISRKFFGTTKYWKKIANANGIKNPSSLKAGRTITIPGGGSMQASAPRPKARRRVISSPQAIEPTYVPEIPSLPPIAGGNETILYKDKGLPNIILPGVEKKTDSSRNAVNYEGLTGLTRTFAAYPLGNKVFSTAFGIVWNKITMREGTRLRAGEDGDYYQFPIALTYAGENFETALSLPFESYDVYAPLTYNFRNGKDSGMGDAALRMKFSSQNENMASCLGIGAIFPTNDRTIGMGTNDNAWEVFGGVSTKKKEGGNFHLNGGYQAGSGNTDHEGVFFNVGFEYAANESFTFMGEVNNYNRVNQGRATDLTLGLRYFVKPGMSVNLAAPISLNNEQFFGYDYRLQGQIQYHY